ncbi:hypothetical protein K8B33_00200 [Alcanivorax sp. JB21]|uniref:outer membrane beta-barrel protein n=1 Tax=Alcanivorax limicola TaxID=2874102 RepID=UPI001CC0E7BC|nr:outer membrane beta-barrel protein [Alcanivorax limicola]MBZ2187504.1 hypothetical protein [Alcanivorax limicola]
MTPFALRALPPTRLISAWISRASAVRPALRGALLTLAMLHGAAAGASDALAPPDVDLFAEVQYARADLRQFDQDSRAEGYRLRGGIWFNSLERHGVEVALEGALSQFVRDTRDSEFTRDPTPQEIAAPPGGIGTLEDVDVRAQDRLDISGFEIGGRLMHEKIVYIRGGLLAYRTKTRNNSVLTYNGSTGSVTVQPVAATDSLSGTGTYAGLGINVALVQDISLVLDVTRYRIESENVDSFAAGLHLRF